MPQRRTTAAFAVHEIPSYYGRKEAENEKPADVPHKGHLAIDLDPVNAEQPMRKHPVEHMPNPEPRRQSTEERQPGDLRLPPPCPPQTPEANHGQDIHEKVEIAVPEDLHAQVSHCGYQAQQVMPLQDLVQKNAIEEAAKRDPQKQGVSEPRRFEHD